MLIGQICFITGRVDYKDELKHLYNNQAKKPEKPKGESKFRQSISVYQCSPRYFSFFLLYKFVYVRVFFHIKFYKRIGINNFIFFDKVILFNQFILSHF